MCFAYVEWIKIKTLQEGQFPLSDNTIIRLAEDFVLIRIIRTNMSDKYTPDNLDGYWTQINAAMMDNVMIEKDAEISANLVKYLQ